MAKWRDGRGRRQHRRNRSPRKVERPIEIIDGADYINSMPDEILRHILFFIPIDLAMRTSVLSRRWRHVWCEMPCLAINGSILKAGEINQTLASYTAPKITSFNLRVSLKTSPPQIDSLVEFAISRNVEKLSVTNHDLSFNKTCSFPDFFYLSSSLKQLSVSLLPLCDMIPTCAVSWKSLRNLSLIHCKLGQESIDNILSGSPILESLTLYECRVLKRLDLRKSLSLRRLEIYHWHPPRAHQELLGPSGPVEIVAPHINYLRLRIFTDKDFKLVDVSSLTEAHFYIRTSILLRSTDHCFQTLALELLAKLHNVERLTLGATLLQILTLAELRGVPFPTLKVQTLIIKTEFAQSVIPGIARLLQNSPGLKKLTVYTMHDHTIMVLCQTINSPFIFLSTSLDRSWIFQYEEFPTSKEIYSMLGCNDSTSEVLALFIELVLRNAKTLETMVVWLGSSSFDDAQWFEEQLQIVGTLSQNNNVSIVLKRSNC
ncbi:unnamed protein product [Eruca vesicaria subsp. sativa]|uniref:F-box domain-containing protein n=1 Tax=Eruca vesicaria subsp. sativa TaxID=29727 RepID=A0ABC8LAC1_ERUVS|nr:unnamed protein product [Eruca vesicaria subsp. sativa]